MLLRLGSILRKGVWKFGSVGGWMGLWGVVDVLCVW